jgi:putative membrane-bound dehydrogenase-like protein
MISRVFALSCGCVGVAALLVMAGNQPRTGPATEKRFPPLQVPAGFQATLFACDPLIEYPSAIAAGPRANSLFVAVDYMTGLGTDIVRRDEIRLIEDSDGDGYADKAAVFAAGFNSIQGLAYHNGTVFVMHAPYLTALEDTDGDGKADRRRDLLTGLGLPPEKNPPRLHCANGVVPGHDGWLYLALGDHGCDVKRPEGDRLVLEGGGILRCRPDGRDLHVFATGLRNIYDVALDEDLNVFVRDNENDGGTYMIRLCHSFFGADHGYPYLYEERPREALPPLANLGLGSSAGGVCYLETGFPEAYRGDLFFCEWGRAVVRYLPQRTGSAFAPVKEVTFASGAANDPYGFRPTDLVVQRDGALFVSDWADGQRPKRGRGRIYRITSATEKRPPVQTRPLRNAADELGKLDSPSYFERSEAQAALLRRGNEGRSSVRAALAKGGLGTRARLHAVWILAHDNADAVNELLELARTDTDPRVQVQAVRAMADLADPVLVRHRLNAETGHVNIAVRLAKLAKGRDARVVREIIIALGRLHWPDAAAWLRELSTKSDQALDHAIMQTLRQSRNWPAVLKLLDAPAADPLRPLALQALAGTYERLVADGLIERLQRELNPGRRRAYADALTRIYKKAGPWVYWGYRPAPRPPHTVAWERSVAIEQALERVLADRDRDIRLEVLRRMRREKVPIHLAVLEQWLKDDRDAARVAEVLDSLRDYPPALVRGVLSQTVLERTHAVANRLAALAQFVKAPSPADQLMKVAAALEDGPVLAAALVHVRAYAGLGSAPLLLGKASSADAEVRSAAILALAELRVSNAAALIPRLLNDKDVRVQRAAASAAGVLKVDSAVPTLLDWASAADAGLRGASIEALRLFKETRALPAAVQALADQETQLAALRLVADLGGPEQMPAVAAAAKANPSADVLPLTCRILSTWAKRAPLRKRELDAKVSELQGSSGVLARWKALGPMQPDAASSLVHRFALAANTDGSASGDPPGQTLFASGTSAQVHLAAVKESAAGQEWLAFTDLFLSEPATIQFLASANTPLRVYVDGRVVYKRDKTRPFTADADRFDAAMAQGSHRVLLHMTASTGADFHVRFRRKSNTAVHERLTQAALNRAGNPERGRKLFFNVAKSSCLKCHRLDNQGERIGPELTGIGNRFGRIHLIESILEPSRWIAPGYETLVIELKDGRVLTGTRVAETAETLTLGDKDGKKHALPRAHIETRRTQAVSTMPDGLERQFSTEEFTDLVAFLVAQK